MKIKPCPCGQQPKDLGIQSSDSKWAFVYGVCCGDWLVEFKVHGRKTNSDECLELALEAWNRAGRK